MHLVYLEGGIRMELFEAIQEGNLEAVRGLLEGGADVNKEDKDGLTPLYYAVRNNDENIVKCLVRMEQMQILLILGEIRY